jgi:hypothetical protein
MNDSWVSVIDGNVFFDVVTVTSLSFHPKKKKGEKEKCI